MGARRRAAWTTSVALAFAIGCQSFLELNPPTVVVVVEGGGEAGGSGEGGSVEGGNALDSGRDAEADVVACAPEDAGKCPARPCCNGLVCTQFGKCQRVCSAAIGSCIQGTNDCCLGWTCDTTNNYCCANAESACTAAPQCCSYQCVDGFCR